jgi:chitinase
VPRNVIYYNSDANQISLDGIKNLAYSDVIIGFLIPYNNYNGLTGSGGDLPAWGAVDSNFQQTVRDLRTGPDPKNVLVSVGGQLGWPSSEAGVVGAWQHYAENLDSLVNQITDWVTEYGLSGVDIDFEDNSGFTDPNNIGNPAIWDGVTFLIDLTKGLAQNLPSGQNIITHAPAPNYFYPDGGYNNAYTRIWEGAGNDISWFNCQFYNNPPYDYPASSKVSSYNYIANVMGGDAPTLMLGTPVSGDPGCASSGYLSLEQLSPQVITPLLHNYETPSGSAFGGVMSWEFAYDQGGEWGLGISYALDA